MNIESFPAVAKYMIAGSFATLLGLCALVAGPGGAAAFLAALTAVWIAAFIAAVHIDRKLRLTQLEAAREQGRQEALADVPAAEEIPLYFAHPASSKE